MDIFNINLLNTEIIMSRFVAYALMATLASAESQDVCRALALRGGGTKGAYEVGVIQSFYDNLPKEEIQYDVVVGVSIGSINAGTIGIYEKGREDEALAGLHKYWSSLDTNDIFTQWPYGPIEGLWRNSIFNNTVSHTLVNQRLINPFRRKVSF